MHARLEVENEAAAFPVRLMFGDFDDALAIVVEGQCVDFKVLGLIRLKGVYAPVAI